MIRLMFGLTVVGVLILSMPWKPPYSYIEVMGILLGYLLTFGPGFLLVVAVLNRLVNISFSTNPKDD